MKDLLGLTADYAAQFLGTLDDRPVRAEASLDELLESLGGPLPEEGAEDAQVLAELIAGAEPGVVGTQTGRYFGFVIGSALPASVAADWLTSVWDQNSFSVTTSPAAAAVEDVAAAWLVELLGLPEDVSSGFVTGAQGANTTALAAARQHVLAQAGWDVARDGLNGAPRIRILVGGERHVTIDRSLRLLGLGTASVELVAADDQGRMQAAALSDALRDSTGRRSSARRQATSTRAPPIPSGRLRRRVRARKRGCTSTAPSASGLPPALASSIWSKGSSSPTPGRLTLTSG